MNPLDVQVKPEWTTFLFYPSSGVWKYRDNVGKEHSIKSVVLVPNGDSQVCFCTYPGRELCDVGLLSSLSNHPERQLIRKAKGDILCIILNNPLDNGGVRINMEIDAETDPEIIRTVVAMLGIQGLKDTYQHSHISFKTTIFNDLIR